MPTVRPARCQEKGLIDLPKPRGRKAPHLGDLIHSLENDIAWLFPGEEFGSFTALRVLMGVAVDGEGVAVVSFQERKALSPLTSFQPCASLVFRHASYSFKVVDVVRLLYNSKVE